MDNRVQADLAVNRLAQSGFLHIGDDLGVDLALSFEHAEDDRLAARAASTFTTNTLGAEARLIDFVFPAEGALGLAVLGDALTGLISSSMASRTSTESRASGATPSVR